MEKKSKGKTIVIVILVLAVLGLGGYIIYDKLLNNEVKEPVKTEKKDKIKIEKDILSEDEALKLGKERYEYVRDGLFLCGYKQVKYDDSKLFAWNENGKQITGDLNYAKITNIEDIKANLTEHSFLNWIKALDIKQDGNDYYIYVGGCGIGPDYAYDKFEIKIKDIKTNTITYSIDEYFYIEDNNGIVEDINKAEKCTTDFEIIKEDNSWKIKEYTDSYTNYLNIVND